MQKTDLIIHVGAVQGNSSKSATEQNATYSYILLLLFEFLSFVGSKPSLSKCLGRTQ